MTLLDFPRYVDHIRTESARFRAVLTDCDPEARVPSCPDWNAGDLLWHLIGVQDHWATMVAGRPDASPDSYTDPERPGTHAELLTLFDQTSARLTDALAGADPAEYAWTWNDSDQTVGFIIRRQAHEALIHRLDAELAAGAVTPLDAALAADGVHEVLGVMYGGCPPWGTFTPSDTAIRVDVTDTGDSMLVVFGRFTGTDEDGKSYDEDDINVVESLPGEPVATMSGTAEALDTWLWRRRRDAADVEFGGDPETCDRFRALIDQPIN
ncbi:maleylpyruvate isomerase family mycothiol-dependent enzyme [Nocardioides speluncae]|uniref:maleylpyruvate isomerase family mycothiol-dependent enzyme n=1 Tax=Nocardioides speluncae TaxID=2670337 RepID=UPI000D69FABB|nr:maleylpyruvate isomerase family mycothiol-dependent enzyme [Nocardioides speluncae]